MSMKYYSKLIASTKPYIPHAILTIEKAHRYSIRTIPSWTNLVGLPQMSPNGVSQFIGAALLNRLIKVSLPEIGLCILKSLARLRYLVLKTNVLLCQCIVFYSRQS